MVNRCFKIQSQLSTLFELLELLPTPVEVDILSRGFKALENFQAITILLQRDGISLMEVRSIFNVLVQDFPERMEYHLGTESCLVMNPDFDLVDGDHEELERNVIDFRTTGCCAGSCKH